MTRGESVAGTSASRASKTTCAVMSEGTRPRAARKGASSTASRRARSCASRGSARWESRCVSPCPGKCLPHESTCASSSPSEKASAYAITLAASRPNARSPMTGFAGFVSMSSTGAKSIVKPSARSCAPSAAAARRTSPASPSAASRCIAGSGSTGAFSRATRPPSWSTATSSGRDAGTSATSSALRAATSAGPPRLRLNRM